MNSNQDQNLDLTQILAGFAEGHPDLLEAYVRLVGVAIEAETLLRDRNETQYSQALLTSQRQADASTTAAHTVFREATEDAARDFRRQYENARIKLNEEIQLANVIFQTAEKPVREGSKERFAALDQELAAWLATAVELRSPGLQARAQEQYQQKRGALIASLDAGIAPARAIYDTAIREMHERFNASLADSNAAENTFMAPFVLVRNRAIEAARVVHGENTSAAYMVRHHRSLALDRQFHALEQERTAQVADFYLYGGKDRERQLLDYFAAAEGLLRQEMTV